MEKASNNFNGTLQKGDSIVEFCKILNLWAGEQRYIYNEKLYNHTVVFSESSRGAQLKDILECLRLEDKLNSTQISKIIQVKLFSVQTLYELF